MGHDKLKLRALSKAYASAEAQGWWDYLETEGDERASYLEVLPDEIGRSLIEGYTFELIELELTGIRCPDCAPLERVLFGMELLGVFVSIAIDGDYAPAGAMFDAARHRSRLTRSMRTAEAKGSAAPPQFEHPVVIWPIDDDRFTGDGVVAIVEAKSDPETLAASFLESVHWDCEFKPVAHVPNRESLHCPRCCFLVGLRQRAASALGDRAFYRFADNLDKRRAGEADGRRRKGRGGRTPEPYKAFFEEVAKVVVRDETGRVPIHEFRDALASVFGLGDGDSGERRIVWRGNDVAVGYNRRTDQVWAEWDGEVKPDREWPASDVLKRFKTFEAATRGA